MRFIRYFDLETMCLNVISKNLDFYIDNINIPEKSVEFLHRAYSDTLYQMLIQREIVEEKYLQWLLTPYWKTVTLQKHILDYDSALKKLQLVGSVISSLNLHDSLASGNLLTAIICCTPNVIRLDLSGTACTDDTLICIRRLCPSLVTLDLANCMNISDNGMINLCSLNTLPSLKSLKHLNVLWTNVSKNGIITILQNMPYLTILKCKRLSVVLYQLHKAHIHDSTYKNLSYSLTEFEHIHCGKIKIFQVLLVWSVLCPCIAKVYIQDFIYKKHIQLLSKFTQLKELRIQPLCWENDFPDSFNSLLFLRGEMLTRICLVDESIAIDALVIHCKNIKEIYFKGVLFKDFPKKNITKGVELKHLDTLIFKYGDFSKPATHEAFLLLLSLSSLKKLCIKYVSNLTDAVVESIISFSNKLETIDFSFTDIKTDSLLPFFSCPSLSKLYIDSCCDVSTEENSILKRFMKNCEYGNTCSWHITFNDNRDCWPIDFNDNRDSD